MNELMRENEKIKREMVELNEEVKSLRFIFLL